MPYQDQKSIAFPGDVQKRIMDVARDNNMPAYKLIETAISSWLKDRGKDWENGDEAQE